MNQRIKKQEEKNEDNINRNKIPPNKGSKSSRKYLVK